MREAAADRPVLRRGSQGAAVVELQVKLNGAGATPPLAVDGIFGPKTQAAVIAFQQAKKLQVDGIVGPQTWGALGSGGSQKLNTERVLERLDRLGDLPLGNIAGALGSITGLGNVLGIPGQTTGSGPLLYGLLTRYIGGPLTFAPWRLGDKQEPAIAIYSPLMTAVGTVLADTSVPLGEYEIGFVQTLVSSRFVATYADPNGKAVQYLHLDVDPLPVRDGKKGVKPWMRQGDVKQLKDAYVVGSEDRPRNMAYLYTPDKKGSLTKAEGLDYFCIWLAARHKPTGKVFYLGWGTWTVDWGSTFDAANETGVSAGGGHEGHDGDKKGPLTPLEGDPVANDSIAERWSKTP